MGYINGIYWDTNILWDLNGDWYISSNWECMGYIIYYIFIIFDLLYVFLMAGDVTIRILFV